MDMPNSSNSGLAAVTGIAVGDSSDTTTRAEVDDRIGRLLATRPRARFVVAA
jgi:hypothetical protein